MKYLLLAGAAALAVAAAGFPAQAVDVVNEDPGTHEVFVSKGESDEATMIELLPGNTAKGVCDRCTLDIGQGGETVQAEGNQIAVIKDGKLLIRTN